MKRYLRNRISDALHEAEMQWKDLSKEHKQLLEEKAQQGLLPFVVTMPAYLEPAHTFVFPFDKEENKVFNTLEEWTPELYEQSEKKPPPIFGVRVWAADEQEAIEIGQRLVVRHVKSLGLSTQKPGGPYPKRRAWKERLPE